MAVAITLLGMIRWSIHWRLHGERPDLPVYFLGVAAVFLVLGLVVPAVLGPVFAIWMRFAKLVNWVMTHVILTIAFFALFVPTRGIMMLLGNDPLNRAWNPEQTSYWDDAEEQPEDFERYKNQF